MLFRNENQTQLIQNHQGTCELWFNFLPPLNHFVIITINVNILPPPSLSLPLCVIYIGLLPFLCEGRLPHLCCQDAAIVGGHE